MAGHCTGRQRCWASPSTKMHCCWHYFRTNGHGVDLDSVLTCGFAVDGVLTGTVVDLIVVVADMGDWRTVLLTGLVFWR